MTVKKIEKKKGEVTLERQFIIGTGGHSSRMCKGSWRKQTNISLIRFHLSLNGAHTHESLLFCCNFPSFSGEKPIEFENVVPFFSFFLYLFILMIVFSCFVPSRETRTDIEHGPWLAQSVSCCFFTVELKKEKHPIKKGKFYYFVPVGKISLTISNVALPVKNTHNFFSSSYLKKKNTVEMMMTAIQIWNRRNPSKFIFFFLNGSHLSMKQTSRSRPN